MDDKVYLGDSVYACIKDGNIILSLNNGLGDHTIIILEPDVYDSLKKFVDERLK